VFDVDAVKKIFAIKRRPADNPLIVHCADKAMIETIASIVDPLEQVIIDTLMPGPITILLRKQTNIPDIVTA
jgi:L-threonylcarbamoyladenylate synthase